MAFQLGIGFTMIRKVGKLPGAVVSYAYDLEYGSDTLQLAEGLVPRGGRVVLIGAEPHLPYERPPLSKGYLAGDSTLTEAFVRPAEFYDTRDINEPVLEKATLELRKVRWATTNKELQAFEINLKPSTVKPEATVK